MRVEFRSRDGLTARTSIGDLSPPMRLLRPLYPTLEEKCSIIWDHSITPETPGVQSREYVFTGFRNNIAVYEEQ